MLRRLYDWVLGKAADPRAEWWLALFAFLEASFFPVPPHPLLGVMCLAEPRKAIRFAAVATLGSVAGGLLGYAIGYGLYESVGRYLIAALGLTKAMSTAQCLLSGNHWAVFLAIVGKGVTPIPFKLVTITAGFLHLPLWLFISASLVSRSISFMIVGILFQLFGAPIKKFIDRYLGLVAAGFILLVIAGFAMVFLFEAPGHGSASACKPVVSTRPTA